MDNKEKKDIHISSDKPNRAPESKAYAIPVRGPDNYTMYLLVRKPGDGGTVILIDYAHKPELKDRFEVVSSRTLEKLLDVGARPSGVGVYFLALPRAGIRGTQVDAYEGKGPEYRKGPDNRIGGYRHSCV